MDYKKYLASEAWQTVRRRIWRRAKGRCESCGDKGRHVHHTTYARLGRELDSDLLLLCGYCHDRAHGRVWELARLDYEKLFGEPLDTGQYPHG